MEIEIYRGDFRDSHTDLRRRINDAAFPEEIALPFSLRQVKTIDFFPEAIEKKMAVGNHYHPVESCRHEFFTVVGLLSEKEKKNPPDALIFKWRKVGESEIQETKLKVGDACFVPAGNTHVFVPLREGICLVGLSNKPFNDADDVKDPIF